MTKRNERNINIDVNWFVSLLQGNSTVKCLKPFCLTAVALITPEY